MCRAYNDWVWDDYQEYNHVLAPMACIAPAALDKAIAEIQRCAALGFKGLSLPVKPTFGPPDVDDPNYNLKEFEPLWDCIDEVGYDPEKLEACIASLRAFKRRPD